MAAAGAVVTRAAVGATDMKDTDVATLGVAIMPEVVTLAGMASWAAGTTAAVDTTVEEPASMVEAEAMVAATSTAVAEATVVGTTNRLLENTNGWQHRAAGRFVLL